MSATAATEPPPAAGQRSGSLADRLATTLLRRLEREETVKIALVEPDLVLGGDADVCDWASKDVDSDWVLTRPRDGLVGHFLRFDDWVYDRDVVVVDTYDGARVGVPLEEDAAVYVSRVLRVMREACKFLNAFEDDASNPFECVACYDDFQAAVDGVACSRCWKMTCSKCAVRTQLMRADPGTWACPCCRRESATLPYQIVHVPPKLRLVSGSYLRALRHALDRLGKPAAPVLFTAETDGVRAHAWAEAKLTSQPNVNHGVALASPHMATILNMFIAAPHTDFAVGAHDGDAADSIDACSAYRVDRAGVAELVGGFGVVHLVRRLG